MRILHCCLAAFYIDNYSYQENILPKMHKLQGHNVSILASTETYLNNTSLGYIEPSSYINEHDIPVTRIPYLNILPKAVIRKLRVYKGVFKYIDEFKPDVIFIHDSQFISIIEIVKYLKLHPDVKVYVDGHTDFINSARSWLSKNILHKIIYKWCTNIIEPFTRKFYGTLPLRVDFFINVYGTPPEKTELLLMGIDDTLVDFKEESNIRNKMRAKLNIKENDFVIITGGKIDRNKNIHLLMKAVNELNIENIKLIVFGSYSNDIQEEFLTLEKHQGIKYVGWLSIKETYEYFFASDLGFFPGTHSVLWEQAVGIGLPCVFKKWTGIQHVDLGGNCLFLEESSDYAIRNHILKIYNDKNLWSNMKDVALSKGVKQFSYYEIAKKAIED